MWGSVYPVCFCFCFISPLFFQQFHYIHLLPRNISNLGSNKSLIKSNVSIWTSLPPPHIPPLQVVTEHWVWAPWVMQQILTGSLFTYGNVYVSILLFQFIPPSPPSTVSNRLFSMSVFSIQFSSVTQSCLTLCDPMNCSTPGLLVHHQLPECTQTHVHWVSDAIQPSHPLSSPSPPAFNLSQHQGHFKWVVPIRWPKYWSFSFSISPSNEHSGLISFRMD